MQLIYGGTVCHWKHWIPCELRNVKEESLEGHMGGIPWKASWSIFSYVFSQCGMKISQKKKKGKMYPMYCIAVWEAAFWNYMRMGALGPLSKRRERPPDLLRIFIKWCIQRSSKWWSKNYPVTLWILCFEDLVHNCSSYMEVDASS